MAKNLIPKIAEMLGVELGEEFKIKGYEELTYQFELDGLSVVYDNSTRVSAANALSALLNGEREIVKLPWKPQYDQLYWTFNLITGTNRLCVIQDVWKNEPRDVALLKGRWAFRTRIEAEAALPDVAEELGKALGMELEVEYEL